jgi:tetratricopeptide (TPR) repeat protein
MPQSQNYRSPAFVRVASETIDLHRLIAAGKGDDPEADEVRDSLDEPLAALTPEERTRAQYLSADLYTLSKVHSDHDQQPLHPQAQANLRAIVEAQKAQQWDKSLALLRRWDRFMPLEMASFQRGRIWDRAGMPEIAAEFYRHAAELRPDSPMPATYLSTLVRIDPAKAAEESRQFLAAGSLYPAAVRILAAYVVLVAARSSSATSLDAIEGALIPVLTGAIEDLEHKNESTKGAIEMASLLLGVAYQRLGDDGNAYDAFSRGLLADPYCVGLLTLRGLLMYGTSKGAISDLLAASRLPAETVWPFFCLAHHYLVNDDYAACRAMCNRALDWADGGTLASKLTEWLAISEAELQEPRDAVRQRFEEAIAFDPENESARVNMDILEARSGGAMMMAQAWRRPPDSAVREQGLRDFRPVPSLFTPLDLAA